jgi:hypothetical protein
MRAGVPQETGVTITDTRRSRYLSASASSGRPIARKGRTSAYSVEIKNVHY